MKYTLLFLLTFVIFIDLSSQIKIAPVEFENVKKVDSAIKLIKTYDTSVYDTLIKYCHTIGFWNGDFSTIDSDHEILISNQDVNSPFIHNVVAVLVHETKHLQYLNNKIIATQIQEEIDAYMYEKTFLLKIPNIEYFLIQNVDKQIKRFQD